MGKKSITITVEGYGTIKVRRPRHVDEAVDAVADAVAQTMQLVDPRTQGERFHPVLGRSGHL
ncbi:hypothetical protein O1W71_02015 [Microbacterium sp. H37-C3]|uniref:hypothetical protein n=1 Tax=Microbacterium sp. H37-C3 TaxID=3004354 RepID=UPI0022B00090|nr:hypothetical protein [Microbacterium sp. H37-C3]MCZ4066443.1 hypothetical protein [Microbacterium sp. H37-C3]